MASDHRSRDLLGQNGRAMRRLIALPVCAWMIACSPPSAVCLHFRQRRCRLRRGKLLERTDARQHARPPGGWHRHSRRCPVAGRPARRHVLWPARDLPRPVCPCGCRGFGVVLDEWSASMIEPTWPAFCSALDEIDGQMVHLFSWSCRVHTGGDGDRSAEYFT